MADFSYKLKSLPDKSGVYIMKNAEGEVIYVGKAKVLKNRVRQYFNGGRHAPKVQAMVDHVADFEYIITDSEVEALVLECNLIKQYMPKYNILLKDDKTYPFIKVTVNEPFPRISVVRTVKKDGAKYFGPYSSGILVRELVELIRNVFRLRSCNKKFPADFNKGRTCLYYHIGKCMGVCTGDVSEAEYNTVILEVCALLNGKTNKLIERLSDEMRVAAEAMDYERAAVLRDQIASIDVISQKQKATNAQGGNTDAAALSIVNGNACVQIFFMRNGKMVGRENYMMENIDGVTPAQILSDFINQYYTKTSFVPDELILQYEPEEPALLQEFLSGLRGRRVEVKVPKIGDNLKLVNMIALNAKKELQNRELKILRDIKFKNTALTSLKRILGLSDVPRRIEAYDISGFAGRDLVGAMVTFVDAKPYKKDYRTFKIKTVDQNDDYASMREVISRRLKHLTKDGSGKKDEKFPQMPDVIFVDGGMGQVHVALEAVREAGFSIPVFGIAKDDKHNTRAVVSADGEIKMDKSGEAFLLLINIQDEMHRRAITHYRSLSSKRNLQSELEQIEGVGEKRRAALFRHFKSMKQIREASVEALAQTKTVDRRTAERIYAYFHPAPTSEAPGSPPHIDI